MTGTSQMQTPKTPLLVRACRGEVLDRPPVWFMRQAGRYMAEYRAIRKDMRFLELCKTPDKAAEVSLQPYKAFGTDGVIMFSDILVIPEAMGMALDFGDQHNPGAQKGPHFQTPLQTKADVEGLKGLEPATDLAYVMTLLRTLSQELKEEDTTLIGFAGAPWTLATYMVEGGGSKNFAKLHTMRLHAPDTLRLLLDKLTVAVIDYLNAQIEAGAQMVQLFDTWGGVMDECGYREWILPYHQRIFEGLRRDKAPAVLYVNNAGHLITAMSEAGADALSVDWRTPLNTVRAQLLQSMTLQGNLDPVSLLGTQDSVLKEISTLVESQRRPDGTFQHFMCNVGHGLIPQTPPENVKAVVDWVKASTKTSAKTLATVTP